jgi:hypothetical protein
MGAAEAKGRAACDLLFSISEKVLGFSSEKTAQEKQLEQNFGSHR